jgi:hypothetical protein
LQAKRKRNLLQGRSKTMLVHGWLKDWFQLFALPSKHRHKNPSFTRHSFLLPPCPALSQKGLGVSAERCTLPTLLQGMVFAAALPRTIPKGYMRLPVNCQFFYENHWFFSRTGSNGSLILSFFKEPAPAVL